MLCLVPERRDFGRKNKCNKSKKSIYGRIRFTFHVVRIIIIIIIRNGGSFTTYGLLSKGRQVFRQLKHLWIAIARKPCVSDYR